MSTIASATAAAVLPVARYYSVGLAVTATGRACHGNASGSGASEVRPAWTVHVTKGLRLHSAAVGMASPEGFCNVVECWHDHGVRLDGLTLL